MLAKVIEDHIDDMEKIEEAVDKDISSLIDLIDMDSLIESPEEYLQGLAVAISDVITEEYSHDIIENGLNFAKEVEKHKIIIEDSNDPKINEDEK